MLTHCPFMRWHQEVTVHEHGHPALCPFPPTPQVSAAGKLALQPYQRVLYCISLNCKKSWKDDNQPTFPNSKYMCVCEHEKYSRYEKCYGKAEKPSPRCKVKMQAACNLGMALLVSLLIKSKTIIVIDTFNPLGRGVLLPVVLVQPEQSLCNRGEPYQHILQNDNWQCEVLT